MPPTPKVIIFVGWGQGVLEVGAVMREGSVGRWSSPEAPQPASVLLNKNMDVYEPRTGPHQTPRVQAWLGPPTFKGMKNMFLLLPTYPLWVIVLQLRWTTV